MRQALRAAQIQADSGNNGDAVRSCLKRGLDQNSCQFGIVELDVIGPFERKPLRARRSPLMKYPTQRLACCDPERR